MTTTLATPVTLPRWRIWLLASRPATLPAAVAPVAVGGAIAWRLDQFQPVTFAVALLGALLLQLLANFANDVYDFEKGADTAARRGPLRVTQAGLVKPRSVKLAMLWTILLSLLAGAWLVRVGGWPIVALGLASIAGAVGYTGGKKPLGYLGLGDLLVFAFFGVAAVTGTVYVQAGTWEPAALAWSVPLGATCTAILVVNNLRDVDTDVVAGKRTLAVRFGRSFARAEYAACWGLALGTAVLAAIWEGQWFLALPVLVAPAAIRLVALLRRSEAAEDLNRALGATARLHLAYGLLAAAGLVLAGRAG